MPQKQQMGCRINWAALPLTCTPRPSDYLANNTQQYIYISSAFLLSKKPVSKIQLLLSQHPIGQSLCNLSWQNGRWRRSNKAYRETGFPCALSEPSLTYDTVDTAWPLELDPLQLSLKRIKQGKPNNRPGDGTSLLLLLHASDSPKILSGLLGRQSHHRPPFSHHQVIESLIGESINMPSLRQ